MREEGQAVGLSIVIPTYNERDNVGPLLREFLPLKGRWAEDFEIIFVDDNSPDGTGREARALGSAYGLHVEVVIRDGKQGIGSAVAEGIWHCHGNIVCVMDADLSHPPDAIPALLAAVDDVDGVVASRHMEGSRIAAWPHRRRLISSVATAIARVLLRPDCRDPLSGFFLFRRSTLEGTPLTGLGSKPLLEILVRKNPTIHEIPYPFQDRVNGKSKMKFRDVVEYLRLILLLRRARGAGGVAIHPLTHDETATRRGRAH